MKLVPLPFDNLEGSQRIWFPFIERLSKRSGEPVPQLMEQITSGSIRLAVIWNEDAKEAAALLGYRVALCGDRVAEMVWLTGDNRKVWQHLMDDFETYAREQLSCARVRPICRPGWMPYLKRRGYRQTHVILEKDI